MSFVDICKAVLYLSQSCADGELAKHVNAECEDNVLKSVKYEFSPVQLGHLSYRAIKGRSTSLLRIYNIPYTILYSIPDYLKELMSHKDTMVISQYTDAESGIRLVEVEHLGITYTVADYGSHVFVINSDSIPMMPSLSNDGVKKERLQYTAGTLHVGECDICRGMTIYYNVIRVYDVCSALSGDLCVVVHTKAGNVVKCDTGLPSLNHNNYKHTHMINILKDSNNLDDRYNTLITALGCLGKDVPDKLESILCAMEDN